MPVIGGKVVKLEVERMEENAVQNLEFTFNIENVRADKHVVAVEYTTNIAYIPSVAHIRIKGEIYFEESEERKAKQVVEEFKSKKRLPNEVAEEVITAMNFSSTAVGTLGAFALGLNAPLNIPRARMSEASAPTPAAKQSGPKAG